MDKSKEKTCCFFGHRNIKKTEELRSAIYKAVEGLITYENTVSFIFGSKSRFDDLCHEVVSELKEKYPNIKRIYARAEFPYIDESYTNHLLQFYEATYYPEKLMKAGKAVYVERNYDMVDKSDFCIVYYDENYMPPIRKNSKRDICSYQPKSGTELAYQYAEKKGIGIINVFQ